MARNVLLSPPYAGALVPVLCLDLEQKCTVAQRVTTRGHANCSMEEQTMRAFMHGRKPGLSQITAVTVCLSLTIAHSAVADGFRNPPGSASALGRVGANIAQIDDASAVTINPANIVDFKERSVMASAAFGYAKRDFHSPLGFSEDTEDPWAYLPSLFAVWPLAKGRYVAGVGLTGSCCPPQVTRRARHESG